MAEKFSKQIEEYCKKEGIHIPPGFYRHSASRFAAIDLDANPNKLIAKTWFNKEDVVYYIENMAAEKSLKILDFKEKNELILSEGGKLANGNSF